MCINFWVIFIGMWSVLLLKFFEMVVNVLVIVILIVFGLLLVVVVRIIIIFLVFVFKFLVKFLLRVMVIFLVLVRLWLFMIVMWLLIGFLFFGIMFLFIKGIVVLLKLSKLLKVSWGVRFLMFCIFLIRVCVVELLGKRKV